MLNRLISSAALLLLTSIANPLFAQDPHFSQFYANPVFLNPALTGSTECGRINLNYRNQWPSLGNAYVTYSASYDQVVPFLSSGIGLSFMSDNTGDGALNRNHINGFYSYKFNASESVFISVGFQGAYIQEKLDWNKLVFPDQMNPSGHVNPSTAETPPSSFDKSVVDFSVGAVMDYDNKFFAGVAVHHLTEPNVSFYDGEESIIPMKMTFHGGTQINLSQGGFGVIDQFDLILSPNILYQQQGEFQEVNFGMYLSQYPFVGGLWLRNNLGNTDAAIVLIGLQHNNYKIGYSFDFSLSKLKDISGGAHEISFSYEFCIYQGEKRRRIKAIKSPTF